MKRIVPILIAVGVFASAGDAKADGAASLDVVGIKLGMTVADAMRALKADNPRMTLTPTSRALEGFASPLVFEVLGNEPVTAGPNFTTARAGEALEILFTLPPGPEVVWGLQRNYHFATGERPSMEATIGALLKKYGPASMAPSSDPRDRTKNIAWVYDAQGRPLGAAGAQVNLACGALFSAHFGGDTATFNEITTGQPGPKECQSIIIATANIQGSAVTPGSSELAVNNLIVQIIDGARHRATTDATRAVALNAANARNNKATEDLKKNGAPKL